MNKEIYKKYSNWKMIKIVAGMIRPYKGKFFLGSILEASSIIISLIIPWILSELVNHVTFKQELVDSGYFFNTVLILIGLTLLLLLARYLAKFILYPIAENVMIDSLSKAVKHMMMLDISWHEKESSGNKLEKINKGGWSLNNMIRFYVNNVIETFITFFAVCYLLYWLNYIFVFVFVFFLITFNWISSRLTKRAMDQVHKVNLKWEIYHGFVFESINNISSVKLLGFSKKVFWKLDKVLKDLVSLIKTRVFYFQSRACILKIYMEVFRLSVIFYSLWGILKGNFEVGIFAVVLLYISKVEWVIRSFSDISHEFISFKVNVLRMLDVLKEEPLVENQGNQKYKTDWNKIILEDVNFSYFGEAVLKDLSLEINRGEKIGIVGVSGAGKSTLFKLLLKMYKDYEGSMRFDNQEFRDLKRSSYIPHVAVVPQDVELFNMSLEENILLVGDKRRKNLNLLKKSLKISHVNDFLYKLPKGVSSIIGEKGVKLSGGEKQRVGIARAIYKEPDILFMDEATSHLDVESEKKIQDALHYFFEDVTAIVIAHRLSTIREMDRIIVMEKGCIIESGTFKQLIRKKGRFYSLWRQQKF